MEGGKPKNPEKTPEEGREPTTDLTQESGIEPSSFPGFLFFPPPGATLRTRLESNPRATAGLSVLEYFYNLSAIKIYLFYYFITLINALSLLPFSLLEYLTAAQ